MQPVLLPSPIQTFTVGFGFSPNPPAQSALLIMTHWLDLRPTITSETGRGLDEFWLPSLILPPVGNYTLPRRSPVQLFTKHYNIF
jgi:hypothetical protein